jgi:branched-chain amino acid transport system substrate-binding protein
MTLPESGPYAEAAKAVLAGFTAGTDLVNKAGGIDGHQIQLITLNDQADPAVAVTVANQLVADHVAMTYEIGFATTSNVEAAIFDKAKIPMLSENDTDIWRDAATYPYFFSPLTQDGKVMQLYAEATEAFGDKRVVIVSDATSEAENWVNLYKAYAKEAGITIAGNFVYPPTAVDATTQVEQAKNTGANTLLILSDAALPAVYSAMGSIGWVPAHTIVSYYATVSGWQQLSSSPIKSKAYYQCSPPALPSTTATFPPSVQSALQSIINASGGEFPGDSGIILNYEIALIAKDAIEHAGVSGPALKAYLETYRNKSFIPSGDVFTFTPTEHLGNTGRLWLCSAGVVGSLDANVYDPAIQDQIAQAPALQTVPNFGPGAPPYTP